MNKEDYKRACAYGNLELVKEIEDINMIGEEAIEEACKNGHYDIVLHLVNHPHFDRNYLYNTLINSCESTNLRLVQYLLEESYFKNLWESLEDELMNAMMRKRKDIVRYLVIEHAVELSEHHQKCMQKYHSHSHQSMAWYDEVMEMIHSKKNFDKLESSLELKLDEKTIMAKNKI